MNTKARGQRSDRSSRLKDLVDDYYEPVLRLLTRLTRSVSVAEDLSQAAFTSLLRSWKPLGTADEDRAYVMQTAYNVWRRWAKKRATERAKLELSDELTAKEPPPLDRICAKEEIALVRAAVDELQPNHQATLVLIVLEGMPYEEVAKLMAVPRDTVAKWRTRALMRMRRALID